MKLRKALDKAKKNREAFQESEEVKEPKIEERKAEDNNGWRPPVYSQSTQVELNTNTVLDNRCICIEPESIEVDYRTRQSVHLYRAGIN